MQAVTLWPQLHDSVVEAHIAASRPPKRGDRVHIVEADGKHRWAEVQDEVTETMMLEHYALELAPGTFYGPVKFAMSREPGTWHWPGGYGC